MDATRSRRLTPLKEELLEFSDESDAQDSDQSGNNSGYEFENTVINCVFFPGVMVVVWLGVGCGVCGVRGGERVWSGKVRD